MASVKLRSELDMVLSQLNGMAEPDQSRLVFLSGRVDAMREAAGKIRDSGDFDPMWMLQVDGDLDAAARLLAGLGFRKPAMASVPAHGSPGQFVGTLGRGVPDCGVVADDKKKARSRRNLEQFVGGSVMGVLAAGLIFVAMILFGAQVLPLLPEGGRLLVLALASSCVCVLGYVKANRDWTDKVWITVLAVGVGGLFVTAMLIVTWYDFLSARIAVYAAVLLWAGLCRALAGKSNVLFAAISQVGVTVSASVAYTSAFLVGDTVLLRLLPAFLAAAGIILLYRNAGPDRILIHMMGTLTTVWIASRAYQESMRDVWFAFGDEPLPVPGDAGVPVDAWILLSLVFFMGVAWMGLFRGDGGKKTVSFQVLLLGLIPCMGKLADDPLFAGVLLAAWCFAYVAAQPGSLDFFSLLASVMVVACFTDYPLAVMAFILLSFNLGGIRRRLFLQGGMAGLAAFVAIGSLLDAGDVFVAYGCMLLSGCMGFWAAYDRESVEAAMPTAQAAAILSAGYASLCFANRIMLAGDPLRETLALSGVSVAMLALVVLAGALLYRDGNDRVLKTGACTCASQHMFTTVLCVMGMNLAAGLACLEEDMGAAGLIGRLCRASVVSLCGVLVARVFLGKGHFMPRLIGGVAGFFAVPYLWAFPDDPWWHAFTVLIVMGAHGTNLKFLTARRFGPYYVTIKSAMLSWLAIGSYNGPEWLSTAAFFVLSVVLLVIGARSGGKALRLSGITLACFASCKLLILDLAYGSSLARTAGVLAAGLLCLGISMCYHRFGGRRSGS